jgi:hypothetical protein
MPKYIIRNESTADDVLVMAAVRAVIKEGLVSGKGTARGEQHCYVTVFEHPEIVIECQKNKSGSETFVVRNW